MRTRESQIFRIVWRPAGLESWSSNPRPAPSRALGGARILRVKATEAPGQRGLRPSALEQSGFKRPCGHKL